MTEFIDPMSYRGRYDLPRGIRNNNPGNLRGVPQYTGASRDHDGFLIFDTPVNGVRAAALNLWTYYTCHKLHTVHAIISRWAPPIENDTEDYAVFVAACMGISGSAIKTQDARIGYAWQAIRCLDGIFLRENGMPPMSVRAWPSWYCTRLYVEALTRADKWQEV